MRQIDADRLYDQVEARYMQSSGEEHRTERALLDAICDSPTIDAIPVEWLCRIIRMEENCRNYKTAKYLTNLILEWHQEADNEDD